MQEIGVELFKQFNIDVRNIIQNKDSFILQTASDKKILKKTFLSPERILFIHGAKEHLYNNGIENIDRFLSTDEGIPYILINDVCFTLHNDLEGRECSFDNTKDVLEATAMLAKMHKASKGYIAPTDSMQRDNLGKLPQFFSKRLEDLKKIKKKAGKRKSKFDYLFLEYADNFIASGEAAIYMLESSNYEALVKQTRNEKSFCHHDFTHNSIIFNDKGAHIINFDYCCYELKVYDIANLIRRKMRKCNWDLKTAKILFNEYIKWENISSDEIKILKIMLRFPQKFWRIINKYYNSKHSWSEKFFIQKLNEVIDEAPFLSKFLENFDKIIS